MSKVLYLESTDDLVTMLACREALELQQRSANIKRPGLLQHCIEAEREHLRAKERLNEAREKSGGQVNGE
jgi:hypothetical protein